MKIGINDKQVELLKQFANNQCEGAKDNLATRKPIHLVQYKAGKSWETVAYFFTLVEAKKYLENKKYSLGNDARTYTVSISGNYGDFEPFWDLLMSIGKQLNKSQEMTDSKELQVPNFNQAEIINPEETEDFLEWLKKTEQRNEFERSKYNAV